MNVLLKELLEAPGAIQQQPETSPTIVLGELCAEMLGTNPFTTMAKAEKKLVNAEKKLQEERVSHKMLYLHYIHTLIITRREATSPVV